MSHRSFHHGRARGFTLVELLVVIALMSVFSVIFYGVFTFNVNVSRVQSQIADMQQNLRVAQHDITRFSRMAGRGGLPVIHDAGPSLPNGVAIAVQNNVAAGTQIGGAGTPTVLVGTDVLTVRGVFQTPVYQLKAPPGALGTMILEVNALTPKGVPQDLFPLADAVQRAQTDPTGAKEPLVVVSPKGEYSVFALDTGVVTYGAGTINPPILKVQLNLGNDASYQGLLVEGGSNPPAMNTVASVGIIEELRYYIRAVQPAPGRVMPRLARARFYPGTNTVHPSDPTAAEDIADHIIDLQIALGVDQPAGAGLPGDGLIYEGARDADANVDEWLFNHANDVPAVAGVGQLELVRMSLIARTDRADARWTEWPLAWLEDHDYGGALVSPAAVNRQHRTRVAQSVVNLRNG